MRFRAISVCLAVLGLFLTVKTGGAVDTITIENATVSPGNTVSLNVTWSSTTALISLSTELILVPVGLAPVGEIYFTNSAGVPAMPPMTDGNYVFNGDSNDVIAGLGNPASVYKTTWDADTYNMADSTNSGTDYAQSGTRLWTVLNLTTTGLASGEYQIMLGSSSFTNGSTPTGVPTLIGGLVTVPEPSTYALATLSTGILAVMARRRQASRAV